MKISDSQHVEYMRLFRLNNEASRLQNDLYEKYPVQRNLDNERVQRVIDKAFYRCNRRYSAFMKYAKSLGYFL